MKCFSIVEVALVSVGMVFAQGSDALVVPRGTTPLFDGACSDYGDGILERFTDAGGAGGTVYLKHDDTTLWACFEGALGSNAARNATLYVDPQGDGGVFPATDDASLEVRIANGQRTSRRGGGAAGAGYEPRPGLDQHWRGFAATGRESVEFKVSIPGLQAGTCGRELGLALGHQDVGYAGDDHFWPAGATADLPESWRRAVLDDPPCACGGTFFTIADTEVREGLPDNPYGAAVEFNVARNNGEQRALLAFDLTASIPPTATVNRAVLELPLSDIGAGSVYTLEARRLDDGWEEDSVTWNSQPPNGTVYGSRESDQAFGVVRIDVTALVRGWSTLGIGEQSLALTTPTDGTSLIFDSREAFGSNGASRIVVRCAQPSPDLEVDETARDTAQGADLDRLVAESLEPVTFRFEDEGGGVRHASFAVPVPAEVSRDGAARARWFLADYNDLMRVSDPATEWQLTRRSGDDRHLHFRQRHQGIPVFPTSMAVHLDGRDVTGLGGRYVPDIARDPYPRLPAVQAENIAVGEAQAEPYGVTKLVYLNRGLLGEPDPTTYLAWAVHFPAETVFVDADSGALLERITHIHDAARLIRNAAGSGPELDVAPCEPFSFDVSEVWFDTFGPVSENVDAEGWTSWNAINDVLSYWSDSLGWDSYDNNGSPVWMYIHVGTQASWISSGIGWPNAISRPKCNIFEYADGTPQLDVVGHEFAHAVTRYTAGLVYQNQSGALNESFSDVFAQRVDDANWTMAEGWPGGPLRDLSDPPLFGQPDRFTSYDSTTDDHGGVHTNSGIPNKAAYLLNAGGINYGYPVIGIGEQKTERLWSHVLSSYLGSSSQFLDARDAFVSVADKFAANKTHSFDTANACSVRNAWAAVEVGEGDLDCDGIPNSTDPDSDNDGTPDFKDNCPMIVNYGQQNTDGDTFGNKCDPDDDGDGVLDEEDNCPLVDNYWQHDSYPGPGGDACGDSDGDDVVDQSDNCPTTPNSDQTNSDTDYFGDACDPDADGDLVPNDSDNCWLDDNPGQEDGDSDGVGDACDLCPGLSDPDNTDTDGDGKGNPCDDDDDADGVLDEFDNCPLIHNPAQVDTDDNGIGLLCDPAEWESVTEQALGGGITVPVNFMEGAGPIFFPLPVGPADGFEELPGGLRTTVDLFLPIPYFAYVVDSEGWTWTMGGPFQGASSLAFQPPAFGATLYETAAATKAADYPSDLFVAPPDQTRFSLVVAAAEPVDPLQTFDLFVRYQERQPPAHVSQVASDFCAEPGAGPGSGVVAPGEDATLALGLGLEGPGAVSAVSATLATTTPGVTVTRREAQFADISGPGGARSLPPHFAYSVDQSLACGTPVDFMLTVNTDTTRFVRHFSISAGGDLFAESADTPLTIRDVDTVVSGIDVTAGGTVAGVDVTVWIAHGNAGELVLTLVDPLGNRVPLALQRGAGPDFAGTTFDDHAYRDISTGQAPFPARFRPETPLDGLTGISVAGTWSLEVTDTVRGFSGQLDAWSLAIALAAPSCDACAAPLPGEPEGLTWVSKTELQWSAERDAGWYNLYDGLHGDLPALLDGQPESCLHWQGTGTSTGPLLAEEPSPGSLSWYIVRAATAAGQGPAGDATSGPRVQNSTGSCP